MEYSPHHSPSAAAPPPIRRSGLTTTALRQALTDSRIETLYQPVVRMSDRLPVGIEALARLDDPERGRMAPDRFVPSMERAGLAWPLTQAVLARAFADWRGDRLRALGLTLAVNIPLDVLLLPSSLAELDAARRAARIPASRLLLELTESRPIERVEELAGAVRRLRRAGYGLAIDDVGPDVRDHSALLALPFTALKLDRDVVRRAGREQVARAFVMSAITAARQAGFTIIAEGVADAASWQRMRRLGVEQAQGFLVARPMPAAAIAGWIERWSARDTG
ncbi:MAG: EAL domain-containing protein [Rhodospirillales bacterium]|nr:EAL domain-containing protein [Rhodospirillales bacterium]MDE2575104.1 EAL domain-containing protein [Rhodospirillales bacterium]